MINESVEGQPVPELERRTLDAWSWIARARAAAARAVAPRPDAPAMEGTDAPAEPDPHAD